MTSPTIQTLAPPSDLATLVGETLDEGQALQVLFQVTTEIQGYTGQNLFQVTNDVIVVDPLPSFAVFVPELPVTNVSLLEYYDDRNGTGWNTIPASQYRWKSNGLVYIVPNAGFNPTSWPTDLDTIRVTYTHGYTTIPGPLYSVCLQAAARLVNNPQWLQSARTGGVQVTFRGHGDDLFTAGEKASLDRFFMPGNA